MIGVAAIAAGLALLAPSIVALLVRPPRDQVQRLPAFLAAALGGVLAGALTLTAATAWHADPGADTALALVLGGLVAGGAARAGWRPAPAGVLTGLTLVVVGYVAHAALDSLPTLLAKPHSLHTLLVSCVLLVAESASLFLVLLHATYALHAARPPRRDQPELQAGVDPLPRVAVQVTVFNEPPEVVARTLAALSHLDHPKERLLVMVLDDSTDPLARAAVERESARWGFQHIHRVDRRGYKAGALNDANTLLGDSVDLVAIVDADFEVAPEWLRETLPAFASDDVAFVQTPQAYVNADESFFARQYAAQDAYFYGSVMPTRNEANSVIFCGTMGIVRLSALRAVGGWSEIHVCEDAEVSLRLVAGGGRGVFVPKVYGRGLIPSSFSAYKRQQHRWAFGNVRIAITRRRLFGSLRLRQRIDFLVGYLHWFDGAFILAIAACLAVMGYGYALGVDVVSHHRGEPGLVAAVPAAILLETILRLHSTLHKGGQARLRSTLAVMGLWCSIKMNNARAAMLALRTDNIPFLRTPKTRDEGGTRLARLARAWREARDEGVAALALAGACAAVLARTWVVGPPDGGLADVLALAAWLGLYACILGVAPAYAYAAMTNASPPSGVVAPVPGPGRTVQT